MYPAKLKSWFSVVLFGVSFSLLGICAIVSTTDWFHQTHRAHWRKRQQPGITFVAGVLDHRQIRLSWVKEFDSDQDQLGEFWYFKFGQTYLVEFDDGRQDPNYPPYLSSDPCDITIIVELGLAIHHLAMLAMIYPSYFILIRYRRCRTRGSFDSCQNCHYNLTGNESGACPECGEKIEAAE